MIQGGKEHLPFRSGVHIFVLEHSVLDNGSEGELGEKPNLEYLAR